MDEHLRKQYLQDILNRACQAGDITPFIHERIAYHRDRRDTLRKLGQHERADHHSEIVRALELSLLSKG
jgi:hypothetical protein